MHLLSSFTDDIGLRREPKGSALPKFPSSVSDGGWFRGYTGSLLRCGLSSCSPPCTDLTRNFPQPTGTFTPELPASRSPFSSSGITTVATEQFPPAGLSPARTSASIAAPGSRGDWETDFPGSEEPRNRAERPICASSAAKKYLSSPTPRLPVKSSLL